MRICFLAGSGSIHTRRWVSWFAQKGHDVHIVFPESIFSPYSIKVDGASLHPFRTMPIISPTSHLLLQPLDHWRVRHIIRRIKPDILHAHYLINYGFRAACSGFHPLVLTAWGSDVLIAPKKSKISRWEVNFALRRADLVTTTSEYLKDVLIREFGVTHGKVMALPWGNDLRTFHKGYESEVKQLKVGLGISDSCFIILSPRNLKEHYRIEHIVRIMPHIVARYPDVVLILCGGPSKDDKYASKINNLAIELRIAQNVKFMDHMLKPEEMAILYNASDVLISIPKSDQFSACIMEGMVCGAIPIVGDLEVYRQYLKDGENALFVDPENPEDIAKKIIYCIEHPELKERVYKINRGIIEDKEDWAKNAPKMEELYINLIQKSRRD